MGLRGPSTSLGAPRPQVMQTTSVPACVGGVNALDSLMQMPPSDCIYTYNAMPVEYGLRLRKGYREWATGADGDVRTIISYKSNADEANDKLWAATENGIYDITLFNTTAPVEDVTFTVPGEKAGYGVQCEFTNDASDHYLFYADRENGLHQYTTAVGWEVPTGWTYDPGDGTPIDFPVADIAFIMVHKLRIWVILEGSDDAWYLPLYSVAGELRKFTFGSKMVHGGDLMGLYTWSMDGGEGIDDHLIAVSRSGDVMVYKGEDPEITGAADPLATNPWSLIGSWFVGEIPDSRRVAISEGSELYLLSTYGITSLRDLLQGTTADNNIKSTSAKVNRFLRADVQSGINRHEWSINVNPEDGFMQVVTPEPSSTPYVQYNQNLSTKAWGFWEAVPMISGNTWNGEYYIGSKSGVVYLYDGAYDKTLLNGTQGLPVAFRLLTSFSGLDNHALYKNIGFIRPIGILAGTASVNVQSVFDYRVETPIAAPPASIVGGGDLWDSGLWDTAVWDFSLRGASIPIGAMGIGRAVAIGMSGNASARFTLVGWDVSYTIGGML